MPAMGIMSSSMGPKKAETEGLLPRQFSDGAPLKSLSSVAKTACVFHNDTHYTLEMLWLNFLGQPVSYGTIPPHKSETMHTFNTHPWVFRVVENPAVTAHLVLAGTKKQVVFPAFTKQDYHIQLAAALPWNTSLHPKFAEAHPDFKEQVQTLLLAHHHLHTQGAAAFVVKPEEQVRRTRSFMCRCLPLGSSNLLGRSLSDGDLHHQRMCESQAAGEGLRSLPQDVVLEIIQYMAPYVPDVLPTEPLDMKGPPEHLVSAHQAAMQIIQANIEQMQAMLAQQAAGQQGQQAGPPAGPPPEDVPMVDAIPVAMEQ